MNKKAEVYKKFLEENKINWGDVFEVPKADEVPEESFMHPVVFRSAIGIQGQNLPTMLVIDDSIYVIINNTMFIIECKFQQVAGSVDEKLQTCDFKKKQYQKLLYRANIEVEYIYLLSNWFRDPRYQDVLDYIVSVNCHYYFEYIPLAKLGLPVPLNSGGY